MSESLLVHQKREDGSMFDTSIDVNNANVRANGAPPPYLSQGKVSSLNPWTLEEGASFYISLSQAGEYSQSDKEPMVTDIRGEWQARKIYRGKNTSVTPVDYCCRVATNEPWFSEEPTRKANTLYFTDTGTMPVPIEDQEIIIGGWYCLGKRMERFLEVYLGVRYDGSLFRVDTLLLGDSEKRPALHRVGTPR